jgi:hypothetical protein
MKARKKRFDDLETFLTSIVMGLIWGMAALINLRKRRRWIKG